MSAATWSRDGDDLDRLLQDLLPQTVPELAPIASISPISAPGGYHTQIRRITLSSGKRLIAKRHVFGQLAADQGHYLLLVERRVTNLLREAGCNVPEVLGTDNHNHIVLLEDVGSHTLDDLSQTHGPVERVRLAEHALEGFLRIHKALSGASLDTMIAAGADAETVRSDFRELAPSITPELLANMVDTRHEQVATSIGTLIRELSDAETSVGPSDYNARNIVVSKTGTPYFLEWSKIGYDWPERRFVQYLTSLGAGRPGSRPRSLIDRDLVLRFAELGDWEDPRAASASLDAHHLIFHVLLASRYPSGDLPKTVRSALTTPISDSEEVAQLRAMFERRT